jgi:hypothetical protein
MGFRVLNLTLKKHKNDSFYFLFMVNFASNFAKKAVLIFKWCKNYTIGIFTIS